MAKHPVFPMWVTDYLADTSHLDATEHGVYHLLLYRYWLTDGRALPEDMTVLRRIAKCRTRKTLERILSEFWQLSAGEGWHHRRAKRELRVTRARSLAAHENAKKRWEIKEHLDAPASNPLCSPSPSPSPDPEEKKKPPSEAKKKSADEKKGKSIPEDWNPRPEDISWAEQEFPQVNLRLETDKFRDHWLAETGQKSRKVQWWRAWRNWIRRAPDFAPRNKFQSQPAPQKERLPYDYFNPDGTINERYSKTKPNGGSYPGTQQSFESMENETQTMAASDASGIDRCGTVVDENAGACLVAIRDAAAYPGVGEK